MHTLVRPHIFGDKEAVTFVCASRCHLLILRTSEAHLRMAGWREDVLRLGFTSQLLREDLALDIGVGADITDGQGDTFAHDFSV